ncbi:MAG: Hpt domain-containing protein [Spirochaeta sp.]|nr:Hpt domain-containing protein [Spirochaeta sp.]
MSSQQKDEQQLSIAGNGLFRRMFFEEGRGMLEDIRRTVDLLDSEYDSGEINNAFRAAHSLKSEASFLRYEHLSSRAHALEDMLSRLRKSGARPSADTRQRLGAAYSALAEAFGQLKAGKGEGAQAGVAERAVVGSGAVSVGSPGLSGSQKFSEELVDPEGALKLTPVGLRLARDATVRGERLYLLQCELGNAEPMVYARLYLVLSNLERRVNVIKSYPPLTANTVQTERFDVLYSSADGRQVGPTLVDVDNVEFVACREVELETLRAKAVKEEAEDSSRFGLYAEAEEVSVRLSTRSYERLCLYADEVQNELRLMHSELLNSGVLNDVVARRLSAAQRMAGHVAGAVEGSSELELHEVFREVAQRVRMTAQQLGKQLRFRSYGGDCRVFLPVGSVLNEAIGHLVRNAVDHGIESSAERQGAGKPAEGLIRVEAHYTSDFLIIEVSDDGRGVDEARVRTAEDQSATGQSAARKRGEPDSLLDHLSRPGFSTKEASGPHSGRGVGLDVVRYLIEQVLGGRLELENTTGQGLMFRLYLPRSTRLMSVLIVRFEGKEFAVPAAEVYGRFPLDRRFLSTDEQGYTYYRHYGEQLRIVAVEAPKEPLISSSTELHGILVRVEDVEAIIVAHEAIAEETVVRDATHHQVIYSQALRHSVPVFVPLRFEALCNPRG